RQTPGPAPRLRTRRDTAPEGVEHAIEQALAKTPADRFATATQFAEALERAASRRAGPGPRRLPRAVVVLGGVLAFVALADTAVLLYPRSCVAFEQRVCDLIADV